MAIVNAQLTTTDLEILTVPAEKVYAITNILVCNNSSSNTASFDLHFLSGQPKNNAITRVINNLELPGGETFTFDSERIILEAGDKIVFVAEPDIGANLTNLSATVSYLEV
jgi:hypothetical protein